MERKAVGMMVFSADGRVAIGKKKTDSKSFLAGKWHIPGEKTEEGEDVLATIKRSAMEKLGLVVNGFMCLKDGEMSWWTCGVRRSEEITPGSDLEVARWVNVFDVKDQIDPLAWDLLPEDIKKYFEGKSRLINSVIIKRRSE